MNAKNALHLIQACIRNLLIQEPFWGSMASMLHKKLDENITALSLDISDDFRWTLSINPHFWQTTKRSETQQQGLIKHQLLHLLFRHPQSMSHFADALYFNMAADLVVNQFLLPAQFHEQDFSLQKLPPKYRNLAYRDVGFYYDLLLKIATENAALMQELCTKFSTEQKEFLIWASWENIFRQASSDSLLQNQTEKLWQTCYTKNTSPELERLVSLLPNAPSKNVTTISWKKILRNFVKNERANVMKYSLRRPSKRYGTVPGLSHKRNLVLWIVVDTSASISDAMLQVFWHEIRQISLQKDTQIWLVSSDYRVHQVQKFRARQSPQIFVGKGSTDFSPALQYIQTKNTPTVIYFTDGKAAAPLIKINYPLLWCIVADAAHTQAFDDFPGKVIFLQ